MSSTCLSNPESYNVTKMRFGNAQKNELKQDNGPVIKYFRIPVSTVNADGGVGELVFETTELFSFGVSVNKNDSDKITGYTLPLCLWNKDGASRAEKTFSDLLEKIVERCKDHLLQDDVRKSIGQPDLERAELKKLNNFIYFKKDENKNVVQGAGPILYPKLIESKKAGKVITSFYDESDSPVDPLTLIGKLCWVKAAVKIESIFIGSKISIQVKLYEANVRVVEGSTKRLLQRPKVDSTVSVDTPVASQSAAAEDDDDEEEDGKIEDSEEEEVRDPTPTPVAAPAVRKPAQRRVAAKK